MTRKPTNPLPDRRGAFLAALEATPDDWTTRLVYADWLEEQGETDLAYVQRWMVREQVRPEPFFVSWFWRKCQCAGEQCYLPVKVWQRLKAQDYVSCRFYDTLALAELDLAQALVHSGALSEQDCLAYWGYHVDDKSMFMGFCTRCGVCLG